MRREPTKMGPPDASCFIEIVRVKQKGLLGVLQTLDGPGKLKPSTAQNWKVREIEFGESFGSQRQREQHLKDYALNVAGVKSRKPKGSYSLSALNFCAIVRSQPQPAVYAGSSQKPLLPVMCVLTDSGERVALREHAKDAVKLDSWYRSIVDALVGLDQYFELPVSDESSSPPKARVLHITPYNVTITSPIPTEVWCARSHNIWPTSAVDVSVKLDACKLKITPLRSSPIVYSFRQGSITAEAATAIEQMLVLSQSRYSLLPQVTAVAGTACPDKDQTLPVKPRPEAKLPAAAGQSSPPASAVFFSRSVSSGELEGKLPAAHAARSAATLSPMPTRRSPLHTRMLALTDDCSRDASQVPPNDLATSPRPNPRKPKLPQMARAELKVESKNTAQDSGSSNDCRQVSSPKPSPRILRATPDDPPAAYDGTQSPNRPSGDLRPTAEAATSGILGELAAGCFFPPSYQEVSSEEEKSRRGSGNTPRPAPRMRPAPVGLRLTPDSSSSTLAPMAAPDDGDNADTGQLVSDIAASSGTKHSSDSRPQLPTPLLEVCKWECESSPDDDDSEIFVYSRLNSNDTNDERAETNLYHFENGSGSDDDIYAAYEKGHQRSLYVNLCNSNSVYVNTGTQDVLKPLLPPLTHPDGENVNPPRIPLRRGVRPNITATLDRIIGRVPPSQGRDPFRLKTTVRRDFCWQLCLRESLTGSWQHFADSAIVLTADEVLMIEKFGKEYGYPPSEIVLHHWQFLDFVECTDMVRYPPTRESLVRILRDLKRDDLLEFLEENG